MAGRQISAAGDHRLTYEATSEIRKIVANLEWCVRELWWRSNIVLRCTFQVPAEALPEAIEPLMSSRLMSG